MDRKLVSIQVISEINPIPDADKIEVAKFQSISWQVVVRKNEFKIGDLCVYFEIDSLLTKADWNAFLFKKPEDNKYRLKTCRLRKVLSQGLVIPISSIPELNGMTLTEGMDLTEILKVEKYEPEIPADMKGIIKRSFPTHLVQKSDELRVQSFPTVIDEFKGKRVYISQKLDGTSASYILKDGEFDVCSRNLSLKESESNIYWKMAKQYDILAKLQSLDKPYAIQTECVGMGIQKNRMGLKDQQLFVFSVYSINESRYLNFEEFRAFCEKLGLQTVPILDVVDFNYNIEELLGLADKWKYPNGHEQEGIVIRPVEEFISKVLEGRASFKVINNKYLEKTGE
jgi:RNA ligase (TIGR02306 family)